MALFSDFSYHFKRNQGLLGMGLGALFSGRSSSLNAPFSSSIPSFQQALRHLRGPLFKAIQLTGAIPGLLPEPYNTWVQNWKISMPSMDWKIVQNLIKIKDIEIFQEPVFPASLGQVHKGRLGFEGKTYSVACKIQYPEVKKNLSADWYYLMGLKKLYEIWGKGLEGDSLVEELKRGFAQELDYNQEALHGELFGKLLGDQENIKVPKIWKDFCCQNVHVAQWVDGCVMEKMFQQKACLRNHFAKCLLKAFYLPFFRGGWLHADPNQGNFLWNQKELWILDFGCVRKFSSEFIQNFIKWVNAERFGRHQEKLQIYQSWGFSPLTPAVVEVLNAWAGFLFYPFVASSEQAKDFFSCPRLVEKGKALAGRLHHVCVEQGGVTIPAEFWFFHRVATVLGGHLMRLKAGMDWSKIWDELMGHFSLDSYDDWQPTSNRSSGPWLLKDC